MPATEQQLRRRIYLNFALGLLLNQQEQRKEENKRHTEALNDLLPYKTPQEARPLTSLPASASRADFVKASHGLKRSVVIRGFAKQFDAVQRWDAAYLLERLGDTRCIAYQTNQQKELATTKCETEEMSFEEYLQRMGSERLYLNNNTEVFAAAPELVGELGLSAIQARFLEESRFEQLVATQVFISSQQVFTRLHHAVAGNFFVQVAGRKRWTFVEPRFSASLMPVPAQPFQYGISGLGGFRRRREDKLELGILECLPRYEIVLEPGDLLYNAPWWWHEVENLEDFNVGCAVRHVTPPGSVSANWHNHALFTALSVYPLGRLKLMALNTYHHFAGESEPLIDLINRLTTERLHKAVRHEKAG